MAAFLGGTVLSVNSALFLGLSIAVSQDLAAFVVGIPRRKGAVSSSLLETLLSSAFAHSVLDGQSV